MKWIWRFIRKPVNWEPGLGVTSVNYDLSALLALSEVSEDGDD